MEKQRVIIKNQKKNKPDSQKQLIDWLEKRNPHQPEFIQAVCEVATDVIPYIAEHKCYQNRRLLERLSEPDRVISFKVIWENDKGKVEINRGWRIQFNRLLGPYKGGLRFHSTVNESILKFLGFEQTLKDSLTGLPMGGAKGGADFNPKGKSDHEVMRFCQSFMTELQRYIGPDIDVPAGDMGVGEREIGYLFGQYMRLNNRYDGSITGKDANFGGSALREEATGHGCIYFLQKMLEERDQEISQKKILISGAGNVALHAAEKAISLGARVLTLSDSTGFIYDKNGLSNEKLNYIKELKKNKRKNIGAVSKKYKTITFHKNKKPWNIKAEIAIPCATQNEIKLKDAKDLYKNNINIQMICEGANMPCTQDAVDYFKDKKILHAPGKAANAGGVAVSSFEQIQNVTRLSWSEDKVESKLKEVMGEIHQKCLRFGEEKEHINYYKGANIAGFHRLAEAMCNYGIL